MDCHWIVYISRYLSHSLFHWVQTTAFATKYKIIPLLDSCEKALKAIDAVSNYEITAAIRKEKNEDSCPIFNTLSNDELKLIFGYVGEKQYGFVACVSDRFHDVYLDTFGGETLTSITSAAVSRSRAELCLGIEVSNNITHARPLFQAAARCGKLDVLIWGEESGYELQNMLDDEDTIRKAALNGHFNVVRYLRELGIPSDSESEESVYYESDYSIN